MISDINNTLLISRISKVYEATAFQALPTYEYSVPNNVSERYIQSLGNSLMFISLFDRMRDYKLNAVYDLSAVTLVSAFY